MAIWTGTVSVTNGDATVTVDSGDALNQFNCTPDGMVVIDGAVYFVLSRTDTMTFELTRDYAGSTDTGVTAEISPLNQTTTSLLTLSSTASRLAAQLDIFDKNSQGFFYTLIGATGDADPGAGNVAFDTIDFGALSPGDAMAIYLDNVDGNGRSVTGLLDTLVAGTIIVVRSLNSSSYLSMQLAGIQSDSGYRKSSGTYVGHDGVLSAAEPVSISYARVGQGLEIDAQGVFADRDDYDAEPEGFIYYSVDGDGVTGIGTLYRKASNSSGDWSVGGVLQGTQGPPGEQGLQGIAGTDGDDGADGASAYDVAVANGFVGNEAAWLASLNGTDGGDGADGADGADGTDPGFLYSWNTGTSNSYLGPGYMWADASLDTATKFFAAKTNRAGDDLSQALADAVISTNTGRKANLVLTRSSGNAQGRIAITALVDHTDYVEYAIASSSHSGATDFDLNDAVSLQINQVGNEGPLGPGGGDVVGPDASTIGNLPRWVDDEGNEIEDSGIAYDDVSLNSENLANLENKTEAYDTLSLRGTAIASATTADLSTATGRFVHITGTTTITGFGTAAAGVERELTFDGALTITHNGTSMITLGGASFATEAGDTATVVSEGSGNWRFLSYQRVSRDAGRSDLVVPTYVASRTAMKALAVAKDKVAILTEAGREGTFKWDGSDLSATIAPASVTSTGVNSTTEVITKTAHGLRTGQAVIPTTTVNGVTADTLYYVIRVDADTFKLAASRANALSGSAFNLTGTTNFTVKYIPDDLEGLYVIPTGKARDGSQGAWARIISDDVIDAAWFGLVGDNSTDDTYAFIGAHLARGTNGTLVYPRGTYKVDSDITLYNVANSPNAGGLRIEATGAIFSGSGKIILDSCKRLKIVGIDMPSSELHCRGVWKSVFEDCRIGDVVIGAAAGTSFSSFAWNEFRGGQIGSVLVDAAFTSYANRISFNDVVFRGDAGQGFTVTRDYAIELNANQDAQNWTFDNCDLSYYNTAIHYIDAADTEDAELYFDHCYFDSMAPVILDGPKRKVAMNHCHVAGKFMTGGPFKAALRADASVWEAAHSAGWKSFGAMNLIANGDFAKGPVPSIGSFPFQSTGGATLTEHAGDGPGGRYVNLDQATSGTIRIRSATLPFTGIYTAMLLLRSPGGADTLTIAVGGQSFSKAIETDWTVFSGSANAEIAGGGTSDITIVKSGGAAFNIDMCYVALVPGNSPPLLLLQGPNNDRVAGYRLKGSKSQNWASINAGANASTTVTVTGAALGDPARAAMSIDTAGIVLDAYVSAADTVTVYATNKTGSPVDLGGGTLTAWVG